MAGQAPAPTQQQAAPGSRYSIPPFTDEIYQPDNNKGIVTALAQSVASNINGLVPFMQSDVIFGWIHEHTVTETVTLGTGSTVVISPYYPFIHNGATLLNMQYQYPSISVRSGIDLALINWLHPLRPRSRNRNLWYQNLAVAAAPLQPQAQQLFTGPSAFASGVAQTSQYILEYPASMYFDSYYELDEMGNPLSGPHNGYISPQNMGGYARVVVPTITMNAILAPSFDTGAYVATVPGSPQSTSSGLQLTSTFERYGVLGSTDATVLPQPTNWQYNIAHQQINLSGRSSVDIPLNQIFAGQILGIVVRLFDPSAGVGGSGAPIVVSTVTNYLLTFGGSVQRFQGTVLSLQEKIASERMTLGIEGVLCFDLATDAQGWRTNSYALNTLRTASVNLHLDFTAALSATAYAEVTIDGLRWVPLPVNPAQ